MKNFDYEYFLVVGLSLTWLVIVGYFIYGMAERFFVNRGKKIKKGWLQHLVRNRRLTPLERLGSRIGYLGAGLLIAAQWTVGNVPDKNTIALSFTCFLATNLL